MAYVPRPLKIIPGVNIQSTPLQTQLGLQSSQLIRHKLGQVQKYGGSVPLSTTTFSGTATALMPWADLDGNSYIAIGTDTSLEVYTNGSVTSIMPWEHVSDLAAAFTVGIGSSQVQIDDAGFTPVLGQTIDIQNLTYVGSIGLQGPYEVISVGVGNYVIEARQVSTAATVLGGTAVQFTTSIGLPAVTITAGGYTWLDYQTYRVGVPTAVGGITFSGSYTVRVTVGPVNTITAGSNASSSTSASENGGLTKVAYLEVVPLPGGTSGLYGAGLYGAGLYGVGTPGSSSGTNWSLAQWGETLLALYTGGPLYEWTPPVAAANVAGVVAGSPVVANGVVVAAPQQQAILWGAYSTTLARQDALLIRWCDVGDLNDWTASTTNQAGSFRLSSGSRIIAIRWFGLNGLIWTDTDLWSMTYVGFPDVYGFNKIGENCGLVAQRALGVSGTQVMWLSLNEFFVYRGGQVSVVPCDVHDFIFNNIDWTQPASIFCAENASSNELAWWFPETGSSGACTAYVKINVVEGFWDFGQNGLSLSAWADQSIVGQPIGADYTGIIQQFERANDFNGANYQSGFDTGWFTLDDAQEMIFLERMRPDLTLSTGGSVQFTITVCDEFQATANPAYPTRTYGPYLVTATTPYFIVRARGRYFQLSMREVAAGTFWRIGQPVALIQRDGH